MPKMADNWIEDNEIIHVHATLECYMYLVTPLLYLIFMTVIMVVNFYKAYLETVQFWHKLENNDYRISETFTQM